MIASLGIEECMRDQVVYVLTRVVFQLYLSAHPIFHSVVCCVVSILLSKFVENATSKWLLYLTCLRISHQMLLQLHLWRICKERWWAGCRCFTLMFWFWLEGLVTLICCCMFVTCCCFCDWLAWHDSVLHRLCRKEAEGVVFVFLLKCAMFFRNPANTWLSALLLCLFILNKPIKALRYAWFNVLRIYLLHGTDISEIGITTSFIGDYCIR